MKIGIRYITCCILLIFMSLAGYAQGSCHISGVVVEQKNEAVPYASAVVYQSGKIAAGALADEKGYFTVKAPRCADECLLVVEFLGYEKVELRFIPDRSSVNLGRIVLKEDAVLLGEAVVVGKTDAVKASVEHTVINASANMASEKGSALDLLTTSSSVTVQNDAVSIRGNSNILILIDGVPTTVTDLSAIPAANIKSIDVVTNPDASYDAEGTGGIINIVSKKTSAKGLSGVV